MGPRPGRVGPAPCGMAASRAVFEKNDISGSEGPRYRDYFSVSLGPFFVALQVTDDQTPPGPEWSERGSISLSGFLLQPPRLVKDLALLFAVPGWDYADLASSLSRMTSMLVT